MRDQSNWKMETKECFSCKKYFTRPCWRKAKFCSYRCARMGNTSGKFVFGEKHYLWKGSKASYSSIHKWVVRHLGQPKKCEHCGKVAEGHSIHWANKSHQYLREINDWLRLCAKCHGLYDSTHRKGEIQNV